MAKCAAALRATHGPESAPEDRGSFQTDTTELFEAMRSRIEGVVVVAGSEGGFGGRCLILVISRIQSMIRNGKEALSIYTAF
jgi:NurA-like 5'-3' nuclease